MVEVWEGKRRRIRALPRTAMKDDPFGADREPYVRARELRAEERVRRARGFRRPVMSAVGRGEDQPVRADHNPRRGIGERDAPKGQGATARLRRPGLAPVACPEDRA